MYCLHYKKRKTLSLVVGDRVFRLFYGVRSHEVNVRRYARSKLLYTQTHNVVLFQHQQRNNTLFRARHSPK